MKEIPENKTVLLFDGVCNFCDAYVQKVIQWDKKDQFVFASLQSEIGHRILNHIGLPHTLDSIVYYKPGYAYYTKADAILQILKDTGRWWSPLFLIKLMPSRIRNYAYEWFAKNRYKWYGKKEACTIPTPEQRKKFL